MNKFNKKDKQRIEDVLFNLKKAANFINSERVEFCIESRLSSLDVDTFTNNGTGKKYQRVNK